MTTAQQKALTTLLARHAEHRLRTEEEWVVVPQGIRAATVWALARAGALEVKVNVTTHNVLRKTSWGAYNGSKNITEAALLIQPKAQ